LQKRRAEDAEGCCDSADIETTFIYLDLDWQLNSNPQ
jgi:hypothetical protein